VACKRHEAESEAVPQLRRFALAQAVRISRFRRLPMSWLITYARTTLGKKLLMGVTGVVLFAYVLVHMLANLQIFLGPKAINHYAALLHGAPLLLWTARVILLFSVSVHIVAAVQLTLRNWAARPVKYTVRRYREADYAARTMVWSGPIIFAFVVYHLADLTLGKVNPSFVPGDVYHNVVASFSHPLVALFYIVAVVMLGFHLYHGLWSGFQTLGASHPTYDRLRKVFAVVFSVAVTAGFVSVPVSVLTGLVH
jgi:succinate dehydrogenase cytochrome b subunit